MSDRSKKIRSWLAAQVRWLWRVCSRWFFPGEETADIVDQPQEVPLQPTGQIFSREGHPEVAVVDLGREVSDALRASWDTGPPFKSGGVIGSAWLQPVIGAGGTAASSLAAGNVFLATANPDTLMTIGRGVGTAVMGPGGIVRHAPFVAAGSAILPVVAPVMLFMTVSSLITGARLDRMQSDLGTLSEVLARVRQLIEAEAYARFQSATEQLDAIWSQFEHSRRFTDGMKLELVQAKSKLSELCHQFGHLTDREIRSENDARAAVSDISLFFLSSIADIRADLLRMYLTLQDDPGFAEHRHAALVAKVDKCVGTFDALLEEDPIESFCMGLERESSDVPFYALIRRLRNRWGGGPPGRIRNVTTIRDDYMPIRGRIERWTDTFSSKTGLTCEPSIIVYRDLDGDGGLHALHTRDLRLGPAGVT